MQQTQFFGNSFYQPNQGYKAAVKGSTEAPFSSQRVRDEGTYMFYVIKNLLAMPEYKDKSIEEIRGEDYELNRKPKSITSTSFGNQQKTDFSWSNTNTGFNNNTGSTALGFGKINNAFGSQTNQSMSGFGNTASLGFGSTNNNTTTNLFGSNTTAPAFGSNTNTFGSTATPAFGSTTAPTFGSTTAPTFGSNTNTFGSTATPTFGSNTNTFGNNTTVPTFGSTTAPTFGSNTNTFGSNTTTPAYGSTTNTSLFGTNPLQQSTNYNSAMNLGNAQTGTTTTTPFGFKNTQPTTMFGNTNTTQTGISNLASTAPTFGSYKDFGTSQTQPTFGTTTAPSANTGFSSSQSAPFTTNYSSTATTPFANTSLFNTSFTPSSLTDNKTGNVNAFNTGNNNLYNANNTSTLLSNNNLNNATTTLTSNNNLYSTNNLTTPLSNSKLYSTNNDRTAPSTNSLFPQSTSTLFSSMPTTTANQNNTKNILDSYNFSTTTPNTYTNNETSTAPIGITNLTQSSSTPLQPYTTMSFSQPNTSSVFQPSFSQTTTQSNINIDPYLTQNIKFEKIEQKEVSLQKVLPEEVFKEEKKRRDKLN